MRDELTKAIQGDVRGPTIGHANLCLRPMPIRNRIDFYDTAGRLHGLIVAVPLLYGLIQLSRGQTLSLFFWVLVLATGCFAIFARRPPCVRLTPRGLSLPDKDNTEYPWDEMIEARAREHEMLITMSSGQRVQVSYRRLRGCDIERLKRLIRWQFEAMAERARMAAALAAPVPVAATVLQQNQPPAQPQPLTQTQNPQPRCAAA
ncbi:hypothetical protein [Fontivita pretiosa]|jgi:hypothetical protein|uniref:hypothetical protein n=1 Tax=Fontivita pretiosa TaxID=2989684 RepID=UPI003D17E9B9